MPSIISAGTSSNTALNFSGDTSGVLQLASNTGTAALTIDTAQNVGIGTASPGSKLAILESTNGNSILNIRNTNAGSSATSIIALGNDGALNGAYLVLNSSTNTAGGAGNSLNITNGFNAPMTFATNNAERMRIDSSGNVGIGVTDPTSFSARLTVAGNVAASAGNSLRVWDSTNTTFVQMNSPANRVIRWTNDASTEYLRINSNGNLVLQGGSTAADGVGITFPASQSASSNSNCLDDYEEGTWSPALTFASGGSVTYSTQAGVYTKIGNFVICTFWLQINVASSPSGAVSINNLPFTAASGNQRASPALRGQNMSGATGVAGGFISAGSTTLTLALYNNGLAPAMQGSVFVNGSEIGGTIMYTTT